MSKKRTVKNVSFGDSEYERGLLEYASKPEHGPFSVYIKRLIEQDRAGVVSLTVHTSATQGGNAPLPAPPVNKPEVSQKDRDEANRLLF